MHNSGQLQIQGRVLSLTDVIIIWSKRNEYKIMIERHNQFLYIFQDTKNFSNIEQTPKWINVNGSCFTVPFEEQCQITWSTITIWILLLGSTLILLAKEIFQVMHF